MRDVTIKVIDRKITNIVDRATMNSLTIVSTLDFYNYGTTQMD